MKKTMHVILGNSAAALAAAKAIRRSDRRSPITMISREKCLPYAPVVLPYLLSGSVKRGEITLAGFDFYKQNQIELLLGRSVAGIDVKGQRALLDDGGTVAYDKLLVATGASPRRLSLDHQTNGRVQSLRSLDDAKNIMALARHARKILAVGAGLVGLETAHAFHKQGARIRVIAKSSQILSQNADAESARILQKDMEDRGIIFLFGRDVMELNSDGDRVRVLTDRGERIIADLVIIGKGADPNVQIVKGTGIRTDAGIIVNERMETSIPNIYAAGDVAQAKDLISGEHRTFGTWPSACMEGETAGLNMAGVDRRLPGEINTNMLPVFGRVFAFIGDTKPDSSFTEMLTCYNEKRQTYRKIILRENRIIGAILLGAVEDAGILRNVIVKGVNISDLPKDMADHPISWGKIIRNGKLAGDSYS